MNKEEIIKWAIRYDEKDSAWSSNCERETGIRIRNNGFLTKYDLEEIVKWKFQSMLFRQKLFLDHIDKLEDSKLQNVSKLAFTEKEEIKRIKYFLEFKNIGISLTSVILTFYDPKNYGVFDIHVWRELFGKEPKNFYKSDNYMVLLENLRRISRKYKLDVRYIEKALFQKNFEKPNNKKI